MAPKDQALALNNRIFAIKEADADAGAGFVAAGSVSLAKHVPVLDGSSQTLKAAT